MKVPTFAELRADFERHWAPKVFAAAPPAEPTVFFKATPAQVLQSTRVNTPTPGLAEHVAPPAPREPLSDITAPIEAAAVIQTQPQKADPMNLAKLFSSIALATQEAEYVVTRAEFYMNTVESSTLTGAQKLAAVKSALDSDLQTAYPALATKFDALWPELSALASGLVTIYRATGEFAAVAKVAEAVLAVA